MDDKDYVDTIYRLNIGDLVFLGLSTTTGLVVERGPSSIWRDTEGMYKLLIGEKLEWRNENVLTLVKAGNENW